MPHQCVKCGNLYDDTANEILKGCSCGARLFFYVKKDRLNEAKEVTINLTDEQKNELESDVLDLLGEETKEDQPVILDFESIRILEPGKYEIDLVHLFKNEPLVFKLADGKYMIDLAATFNAMRKK
jgi:predicted  nucleic acid-binding Zn-ribbon protein